MNWKKRLTIAGLNSILGLSLAIQANSSFAKEKPVLAISLKVSQLPGWESGLQDPSVKSSTPSDDLGVERLKSQITSLRGEHALAKTNAAKLGLLKNILASYLKLSYFYENALNRKNSTQISDKSARRNLVESRKMIIKFAKDVRKATRSRADMATADYHTLSNRYLLRYKQATQVAALQKVTGLNGYLKNRRDYLVAMHGISYGNAATQKKSLIRLNGLISKLPLDGAIAARLAVARYYAGLNRTGSIVRKKNSAYRGYLFGATDRASRLSTAMRNSIANVATAIWIRAEGNKINWSRPPLRSKFYAEHPLYLASHERYALSEWRKKNYRTAAAIFKRLSTSSNGSLTALSFDKRYVRIKAEESAKAKSPSHYEQALVYATKRYRDSTILGERYSRNAEIAKQSFNTELDRLVNSEIKKARSKKATTQQRRKTIMLAHRHVERTEGEQKRESLRSNIASLYILNKDYTKGVDIYIDLALNGTKSRKTIYLSKAIAGQSQLAKWPANAPWDGVKPGPASSREKLRDLYTELNKTKPSWAALAHQGLLDVSLGNINAATNSWLAALESSKSGHHSNRAAGFVLHFYEVNKSWDNLESLARLSIIKKLRPVHLKRSKSPQKMLALALFEGGKSSYQNEMYSKAVTKLREFVKLYQRDTRNPEAMFYLAKSERGNAEYPASILTMRRLVQKYPKSKFNRKALIIGGNWALEQALDEDVIFFHKGFLKKYPRDKARHKVQLSLLDIYLGKEMYNQVISLLNDRMRDRQLSMQERVDAGKELVSIERRHGSLNRASTAANNLHKLVASDDSIEALRISIKADQIIRSEDKRAVKKLVGLTNTLRNLDKNNQEVLDTHGAILFQIAIAEAKVAKLKYYNLALKDPSDFLKKQNSHFKRKSARFEAVCRIGANAYCAPAYFQSARLAEDIVSHIEDLSVPDTLSEKSVAQFKQNKFAFISALTKLSMEQDEKALEQTKDGLCTPKWTQQITWHSSSDWHFRSIQNKSGTAFVQIEPGDNAKLDHALRGDH